MSLTTQLQRLKERKANGLVQMALRIQTTIIALIARDSGRLENSIATGALETRGSLYKIDVGALNERVPYDIFVEEGVRGQTFQYHRDGVVVYEGVGQHFLKRSVDVHRPDFLPFMQAA